MLGYTVGKITEILVAENSNKLVMEFSIDDLKKSLGEPRPDITHGFPLTSNSLVLFSHEIGEFMAYDLRSGSVGALLAHPLKPDAVELASELSEDEALFVAFSAQLMKLSLRNILAGGPATSSSRT